MPSQAFAQIISMSLDLIGAMLRSPRSLNSCRIMGAIVVNIQAPSNRNSAELRRTTTVEQRVLTIMIIISRASAAPNWELPTATEKPILESACVVGKGLPVNSGRFSLGSSTVALAQTLTGTGCFGDTTATSHEQP